MGSTTDGREVRRRRANRARLRGKLAAKKVLTAAQFEYLDDLFKTDKHHGTGKGGHRCAFCGPGGHKRGGSTVLSANGTKVRL